MMIDACFRRALALSPFLLFSCVAPEESVPPPGAPPLLTPVDPTDLDETWWGMTSAGLRARAYAWFAAADGSWTAQNHVRRTRLRAAPDGFRLAPTTDDETNDWSLAWGTTRFGRGTSAADVPVREASADRNEVRLDRGALVEWLRNGESGIEHGWTIADPPAGSGALRIEVAVEEDDRWTVAAEDSRSARVEVDGGRHVGTYANLRALDAVGRELDASLAVERDRLVIRVDDSGATYPVTVDPGLLFAEFQWGRQDDELFGFSVATAGDVNGDGLSDLLVGAPHFDPGGKPRAGRVDLFYGGTPLPTVGSAPWSVTGGAADARWGTIVSPAGDVNGDGFDDFLATSYGEQTVHLWQGAAGGPAAAPSWSYDQPLLGASAAYAGDLNGDGLADVAIARSAGVSPPTSSEVLVFYGSGSGLAAAPDVVLPDPQPNSDFGRGLGTAGDVDGDGFDDLAVGAPYHDGRRGAVYVYRGSASGLGTVPAWTELGAEADEEFGWSVGMAGDVDGDGYSDIVAGAPQHDGGLTSRGRVALYRGAQDSNLALFDEALGESAGAQLGWSVTTAGDADGDGYADVAAGAPTTTDPFAAGVEHGRAWLYLGGSAGLSDPIFLATGSGGSRAGHSVACAGDFDGNGFADVVVGSPMNGHAPGDFGSARLVLGTAELPEATPSWATNVARPGIGLGETVAAAGDVNGDGYMDVLVGAPDFGGNAPNAGLVLAYHGGPDGLPANHQWEAEGLGAGERFGAALSSAGDVDGDGYADVLVGAPGSANAPGTYSGAVDVFRGGPNGLSNERQRIDGEQSGSDFGFAVARAGDVNGDGLDEVVFGAPRFSSASFAEEGKAYLAGWNGQALEITWAGTPKHSYDHFGFDVEGVGDQDGDGLCDVAIGSPRLDRPGRVYVFLGTDVVAPLVPSGLQGSAQWILTGDANDDRFGHAITRPLDYDRDGRDDFFVGAPDAPFKGAAGTTWPESGLVWWIRGSASGPTKHEPLASANGHIGRHLAHAGDVDADGYDDLAIALPIWDYVSGWRGHGLGGIGAVSGWLQLLAQHSETLPLAGVGDVNGDGFDDLLVGEPGYASAGQVVGRAVLYLGNADGGRSRGLERRTHDDAAPLGPLPAVHAPDGFRATLEAFSPFGRRKVRLEADVRTLGAVSAPIDAGVADTGAPAPGAASVVEMTHDAANLTPAALLTWRLRLTTAHPFFPTTPWIWPGLRGADGPRVRSR